MILPDSIRFMFEAAGWTPQRKVTPSLPNCRSPAFRIGYEILSQFEGLRVGRCGPGKDQATSDIFFDPADGIYHLELGLPVLQNRDLCPIGEFHHSHGLLFIDDRWSLYFYDMVANTGLRYIGSDFIQGLHDVLFGVRPYESDRHQSA